VRDRVRYGDGAGDRENGRVTERERVRKREREREREREMDVLKLR
jgi:hypothetical protein